MSESCAQEGKGAAGGSWISDERAGIEEAIGSIRNIVMVLSGKGGVGKSTVAANLAMSLSLAGKKVGLLDVDLHGPSIPGMLGLSQKDRPQVYGDSDIQPVRMSGNLSVMSLGLLLTDADDAVAWRGPRKYAAIKQLIQNVTWGPLDYLVIDSPPGTGDEPMAIAQLLGGKPGGAVIVTTPQKVAISDVRRGISFCRDIGLAVLGVIENMSGFVCPCCGKETEIFKSGGGEAMATEMCVPFLGRIPIDPQIVDSCDSGKPYVESFADSHAAKTFGRIAEEILALDVERETNASTKGNIMRIAIPVSDGKLCQHFGHCERFAVLEVDVETKKILAAEELVPPAHEPGVLPKWLHGLGVKVIIAGGMGSRAQQLFHASGVDVLVGASGFDPRELATAYLNGSLATGANACDH